MTVPVRRRLRTKTPPPVVNPPPVAPPVAMRARRRLQSKPPPPEACQNLAGVRPQAPRPLAPAGGGTGGGTPPSNPGGGRPALTARTTNLSIASLIKSLRIFRFIWLRSDGGGDGSGADETPVGSDKHPPRKPQVDLATATPRDHISYICLT